MSQQMSTVFDSMAPDYDKSFSGRLPARHLRRIVRKHVTPLLPERAKILDIGCGTGSDAFWFANHRHSVLATDVSESMLHEVNRKRSEQPEQIRSLVRVARLDARSPQLGALEDLQFDLVHSNFGALNCVSDLRNFFDAAAQVLHPDGAIALTLMGRFCLWESIGFALRGDFRRSARRWGGSANFKVGNLQQQVWYHSPSAVARMAKAQFAVKKVVGVGVVLPSTEFFSACERRPRLCRTLAITDARISGRWPFNRLGDHFLIVLKRNKP